MTVYKGTVAADGTWKVEAAGGWTIEKLEVGLYRIHHYQANVNYSVNIHIKSGTTNMIYMGLNNFDIQVKDGSGNAIDNDFSFDISFIQ